MCISNSGFCDKLKDIIINKGYCKIESEVYFNLLLFIY